MPSAENDPKNEADLNNEVSEPAEASASRDQTPANVEAAEPLSEGAAPSAPADQAETSAAPTLSGEGVEAPTQRTAVAVDEPETKKRGIPWEEGERKVGPIFWLTLGIGALGLLLMPLLPWLHIYYQSTTEALDLTPVPVFEQGIINLKEDNLVNLGLRGSELLTAHFWQLLVMFALTALLLGATIYWQRTRFARRWVGWAVLCLALLVGFGFPWELHQLLVTPQRVDWNNDQATIQANKDPLLSFSARSTIFFPCPPNQSTCAKDYIINTDGQISFILSDGFMWEEVSTTNAPLVAGYATTTRESPTSSNVTTSGYAVATFGNLNPSIGYWGAWAFSLWILVNTPFLLNRLWRRRR